MINVLAPGANVALFRVDKLAILFAVIFGIAGIITFIYSHKLRSIRETLIEIFYAVCSIGIVFANDWITMVICWEMMAVCSWFITNEVRTPQAKKASLRYLCIHMFGGNMLLVGAIMKILQGSYEVSLLTGNYDTAYWFILIGVGVNAALPPLNSWVSDAYPEATLGGTVMMAAYTTKVGMYFLIRCFAGEQFLLYFGVFMALYGACMAMMENDLRRLLCYHIVSQLGYIVSAIAIGTELGIDGAACHAFNNILYKCLLLMCAGAVVYATGKRKITELGGMFKKMPLVSICFLIASLSIAGFPFLNGFASKGLIMGAVEESGIHWAQIGLTVASVGTFLSIPLKCNYFVFFGKENPNLEIKEVPTGMKIAIVMGTLGCIITGLFPGMTTYALAPFATDYNPFTLHHILEYIELFIGGGLAFYMYRKKMMPHDALSLDFDWLYRKPIKWLIWSLSDLANFVLGKAMELMGKFVKIGDKYLHRPYLIPRDLKIRIGGKKQGIESDDVLEKPAGRLVGINMGLAILIVIIVLIFT